jgi:signal transduction histidine kinase
VTEPSPGTPPGPEDAAVADRAARLGEEARRIGHDLNNCLGVIVGRAELARLHLDRGNLDGVRKGIDVILGHSERIKRLSDELRALRHQD